jgi:hypothetical protein
MKLFEKEPPKTCEIFYIGVKKKDIEEWSEKKKKRRLES